MSSIFDLVEKIAAISTPILAIILIFYLSPAQMRKISAQKRVEKQTEILMELFKDLSKIYMYSQQPDISYTADLLFRINCNAQLSQSDKVISAVNDMMEGFKKGGEISSHAATQAVRDELRKILGVRRLTGPVPNFLVGPQVRPRDHF